MNQKPKKNVVTSVTIVGLVVAAIPIVAAIRATGWTPENLTLLAGWMTAVYGRVRQGDLSIIPAKPPAPPVALVLMALGVGTFSGCVAPASEQGHAAQGGSTGTMPVVNVTVTFGGKVDVSGTSSGTAAPSAASEAQNRQEGKNDISVPIDASGVIPAAGAGKVLGAPKLPSAPVPAPVVVPAEIVAPAPVPAPAPTVPEAPAPAPVAPIGG